MTADKVKSTIITHHMIEAGDCVLCAVSGGADSLCMLHVLLSLREELGFSVRVAHLNHSLRGEASDGDEAFVAGVCAQADIPYHHRTVDVRATAEAQSISLEEAGRNARYAFFFELAAKFGADKIATAHHLDDNCETVLFRMIRGSGGRGMRGIPYVRDRVIRPLLDLERREIEDYLTERGIAWRTDRTNECADYARNRIRMQVVPPLMAISPAAARKIVACARLVAEDDGYLSALAAAAAPRHWDGTALRRTVLEEPLPLRKRIAATALRDWGAELSEERVETLLAFLDKPSGKQLDLGGGGMVQMVYDAVAPCLDQAEEFVLPLFVGSGVEKDGWRISAYQSDVPMPSTRTRAVFDAEAVCGDLWVRTRRMGDRIALPGMSGSKKLKDFFIDNKIPIFERMKTPLVECGNEILYIAPHRASRLYAPTENTKLFLVIEYSKQGEY